jgi:DNA-binding NarL/FixJ family response regulator
MITVVLADDQPLVRIGFAAILGSVPDIEVVGEAADGHEAVSQVRTHRPDIVLMDIRMPGMDGLAATKAIVGDPALAAAHVIILTTFETDEYVSEALRSGAAGFLLKHATPEELVRAVRVTANGEAMLSPGVARRLVTEYARRAKEPVAALAGLTEVTDREREVIAMVGHGLSNDEIAATLHLSIATVRTHLARAMHKLDARTRAELVVIAYETGIVRPGWLNADR